MKVERLAIPDVILLTPPKFGDHRGFFSETFKRDAFAEAGVDQPFVQDNQSLSAAKGTLRGLHCQIAPYVQGKLVRVLRGAIWDVAVDIRKGSPTYGKHVGATLSAANWSQLWVPGGFLHGFVTLESDTEVTYKVTSGYDRASERGVIWNDPDLGIDWPVAPDAVVLSEKDTKLPRLAECEPWFSFEA
jgi:dTDP-4-dehydrorhamnose 3,5-epimerase